jgi:nucleolar protein 4
MDPNTGRSRGTGFVSFFNPTDAAECIDLYEKAAQAHAMIESENGGATSTPDDSKKKKPTTHESKSILIAEPSQTSSITTPFILHNRFLNLTFAVSKTQAATLTSDNLKIRRAKDKRNMYLVKEGVVFANSKEAVGVSASEMSKRVKSYQERKRLLETNPNLFISKTKLSVRNLLGGVDEKGLKRVGILAVMRFREEVEKGDRPALEKEVVEEEKEEGREEPVGNRRIVVTKAKVLLDLDKGAASGAGKGKVKGGKPVAVKGGKKDADGKPVKPKSKGYGFIEFESHADALCCLRWLNNNPFAFTSEGRVASKEEYIEAKRSYKPPKVVAEGDGKKEGKGYLKRPIVEFAVENRQILKKLEDMAQANKEKRANFKEEAKEKVREKFKGGKKRKAEVEEVGDGDAESAESPGKRNNKKAKKDGKHQKQNQKELEQPTSGNATILNDKKRKTTTVAADSQPSTANKDRQQPPAKKSKDADAPVPAAAAAVPTKKAPKKPTKAEQRDNADEAKFSQLLQKYGKGLFGNDNEKGAGAKSEAGEGGFKKWYV